MANTFLKPTKIAATFLGLLQREIVLPRVVSTFGAANFAGAANDTVTLRVPAVLTARDYEWRTRTNPIVVDDITETGVDVKLDKQPYHAGAITDEQLALDIEDFAGQVLAPQVRAVAERLEGYIASTLSGGTYQTALTPSAASDDPYKVLTAARKALNLKNVPLANRVVVVGADVEEWMLNSDRISKAQNSGEGIASSALAEARIGRVAGFDIITSNALAAGEAYAMHKSAVVFANMAPPVPAGATFGSSQAFQGLAMRWLRDYDPNYLRDRSVVSAFAGTTLVADGPDGADVDTNPDVVRAVKITLGA